MKKKLRFKDTFPYIAFDPEVRSGAIILDDGIPQETRSLKTPGKKWSIFVDLDESGEVISVEVRPKSTKK